ncbi:TetR/AcrR family transcriptional regulator [Brevibacterium daeguense]|uniref:TetR/AcrR family transcriptional regulator n=1 Tax=Brevibacterium daeguense TaxID=909936 RepID=A0ABP8EEX9_9MICO|nr:TetR/AcrR family transcriptional regulator [Brevibacterium daeguense]
MSKTKQGGRPLNADLGIALENTAREMLIERGYEGFNVDALVKRVGTTRPAFYRRYRSLTDLVLRLLLTRYETQLDRTFDTGRLESDLFAIQSEQLEFFRDPVINRGLPGFLASLRSDDELRSAFDEEFLLPRRQATAAILQRGVARGEVREGFDPAWICDLLTGPFILRVQLPEAGPLDEDLVRASVDAALCVLQRRTSSG